MRQGLDEQNLMVKTPQNPNSSTQDPLNIHINFLNSK